MKTLKIFFKTAVAGFLLVSQSVCFADYSSGLKVGSVATYPDGLVLFTLVGTPANTCNYWGFRFKFYANTVGSRNMLATLLAAKATDKTLGVAYGSSTAPIGSDHTNGCTLANMASVQAIVIE